MKKIFLKVKEILKRTEKQWKILGFMIKIFLHVKLIQKGRKQENKTSELSDMSNYLRIPGNAQPNGFTLKRV